MAVGVYANQLPRYLPVHDITMFIAGSLLFLRVREFGSQIRRFETLCLVFRFCGQQQELTVINRPRTFVFKSDCGFQTLTTLKVPRVGGEAEAEAEAEEEEAGAGAVRGQLSVPVPLQTCIHS